MAKLSTEAFALHELCPSCGAYWQCEHRWEPILKGDYKFGFQTILDDRPVAPEMEPSITMQDGAGNNIVLIDECHGNP